MSGQRRRTRTATSAGGRQSVKRCQTQINNLVPAGAARSPRAGSWRRVDPSVERSLVIARSQPSTLLFARNSQVAPSHFLRLWQPQDGQQRRRDVLQRAARAELQLVVF